MISRFTPTSVTLRYEMEDDRRDAYGLIMRYAGGRIYYHEGGEELEVDSYRDIDVVRAGTAIRLSVGVEAIEEALHRIEVEADEDTYGNVLDVWVDVQGKVY
jgi:hypothetical protein